MERVIWKKIEDLDDLISDKDRLRILDIERRNGGRNCPLLGRIGDFFYFCDYEIPRRKEIRLVPNNPFYKARQNVNNLRLLCLGEYKNCSICQEYLSYLKLK